MSEKELPIIPLLTVVRYSGEFALVEIRMRGDEVVSRDVIEQGPFAPVWTAFNELAAVRFGKKEMQ